MTSLWKAYRFVRREHDRIDGAMARDELVAILDRAKGAAITLNPRPSMLAVVFGVALVLVGGLGFLATLASEDPHVVLLALVLAGGGLLAFDFYATETVADFLRRMVTRAAHLDFRFAEPDVDLRRLLEGLRGRISDFARTYADNGELEYCRKAVDDRVGGEYWVYRFAYAEGDDMDRRTYHRNGLICDLFDLGPVDLCNPREGKWKPLRGGGLGERIGEAPFSRYFVACTAADGDLERFLTPGVQEALVRLARGYPEVNVQVTEDHLLCLTWSGEDPYATLFEPVVPAMAAAIPYRHGSSGVDKAGEDPDAIYRSLELRLRSPRHLTGLEPLLNALKRLREHLEPKADASPPRPAAKVPLSERVLAPS